MIRVLAASALVFALAASLGAASASAYTSTLPTSPDSPFANKAWFVDWSDPFALSQEQFLRYLTNGDTSRTANVVYGDSVANQYRYKARRDLNAQARREVGTDPYSWLPRIPEAYREKARLMLKMARNPQVLRFGNWNHHVGHSIRVAMQRLERSTPGGMAFIYMYRLQKGGTSTGHCGNRFAGGPRFWAGYKRWIRSAARALNGHNVVVFLEPDGLGTTLCLSPRYKRARYSMFRYAIRQLSQNPNGTIYLDAARSNWNKSLKTKARMLRKMGVMSPHVRGFFSNSTGYQATNLELRADNKLSRMLGGKHYVISTHMNGRGTYHVRIRGHKREVRCNPPNRALGPEPTVRTGSSRADAYVWLGIPGKSAGCSHPGQPKSPPAKAWWEWYALDLARNARWQ